MFRGWSIVGLSALALGVLVVQRLFAVTSPDEALASVLRVTARVSFGFFLAAFTASALHALFPSRATRWQIANRRYLGVSFGVAHLVHGAFILIRAWRSDGASMEGNGVIDLLGGGIVYVFIVLLIATSFDRTARALPSGWWKRLHGIGVHVVWIAFALAYGISALEHPAALPAAALAFGALAARIAAYLVKRAGRSAGDT